MLRIACHLCRSVLLSSSVDSSLGQVAIPYAACSLVKAVTYSNQLLNGVSDRHIASSAGEKGIIIDDTAVRRLKELQAEAPDTSVWLRIEVEGGGCSGFQYKFKLDDQKAPDDIVFERDGVKVVCDSISLDFLQGAVVEFEDSLMRSAFQIASNPNSESTCGCGTSFVAKI